MESQFGVFVYVQKEKPLKEPVDNSIATSIAYDGCLEQDTDTDRKGRKLYILSFEELLYYVILTCHY